MLRRITIGLLASAVAVAPLPLKAQDGSAEDLGDVMSISLKDVVKPTLGFQGALQGAGTPNQAGIGGFLPLSVGDNSIWFVDALAKPTGGRPRKKKKNKLLKEKQKNIDLIPFI